MKFDKQTLQYLFIIILGVIGFNYLLNNLHVIPNSIGFLMDILVPFIIGVGIAFIVNVPMKMIEAWILNNTKIRPSWARILALLLAIFIVIGLVVFVVFMIVPAFVRASIDVFNSLPQLIESVTEQLNVWFKNQPQILEQINNIQNSWNELLNGFVQDLTRSLSSVMSQVITVLTTTIGTLFNILVGFVFAIYVLLSKESLKRHYRKILFALFKPSTANYILDFGTLTNHIFTQFLTGQVTEGFINGFLFFVASFLLNFPYGIVIAVVMGFMALIPYFGAFIGTFIGAILIASQSIPQALLFVVVAVIIQQIDGNVIYPRVVGNQIGLPAIWVLVAVTIGASVWGVLGMVVMVPFASVLYALVTMWINRRLEKSRIDVDQMESRKLGNLFPKKDGSHDDHTI